MYFQGVGSNIRSEDFVFEAQKYDDKMIIIAPQLNDWGQTSARQAVALTEFMLANCPIDKGKVFINGYSGGGETLSLVLTIDPELFTAALHVASVWDGELEPLVYFVIGESDEYYGSSRITATYNRLVSLYLEKGLSDEDIKRLAVLDVKPRSYFNGGNQHGGIGRVSRDEHTVKLYAKDAAGNESKPYVVQVKVKSSGDSSDTGNSGNTGNSGSTGNTGDTGVSSGSSSAEGGCGGTLNMVAASAVLLGAVVVYTIFRKKKAE